MGLHLIEITLTIGTAISTTIYAAQAAIHNTMNISPESLIPYFDDAWVTELEHLSISFLKRHVSQYSIIADLHLLW